jgi:hypothetical protein
MPDILPTHTCFDDALDFIYEVIKQHPDNEKGLYLVHGIVYADGRPSAHAWVEDGDKVIFAGILEGEKSYFAAERKEYYRELKVKTTAKYSVKAAMRQNLITGNYGPWLPQLKALCRQAVS